MDVADAIDRARQLQMDDRADEALELLLAAAKEHSDEDLNGEIALFYAERGWSRSDDEALADFQEARKWSDVPLARAGEAKVLLRRGEPGKAEQLLAELLELDPEEPHALLVLGELKLSQGAFEEAGERFGHLVQLAPQLGLAYLGLARALTGVGRVGEAHAALEAGIGQCPSDDALHVTLAASLTEAKEFDRAKGAWRRAAQINRMNPAAWRGVAGLAAETGDEVEMHRALDRAMELDADGTREWLTEASAKLPLINAYLA